MSSISAVDYLTFFVNGEKITENYAQPEWTLLWYLRHKCRLTGSKLECGEGGCDACTVLVSHFDVGSKRIIHRTLNGCLTSICSVDGCHITTVEGITTVNQQRIAEFYASQCGFCASGIVMSLYGILNKIENPTMKDIEDSLDGNLCRCTGYRPILDAAKSFACHRQTLIQDDTQQYNIEYEQESALIRNTTETKLLDNINTDCPTFKFPSTLMDYASRTLHIRGKSVQWYQTVTFEELIHLKKSILSTKIVSGNTIVQMNKNSKEKNQFILISVSRIPELNEIIHSEESIVIGAAVTISKLKDHLESLSTRLPEYHSRICHAL